MDKKLLVFGATFAGLAVAIGAFGAHALEPTLLKNGRVDTFETAVLYHMFHSLATLFVGGLSQKKPHPLLKWSGALFSVGILVFSGSLYILSVTNITLLGAITPLGGVCFIVGWITLIYHFTKNH